MRFFPLTLPLLLLTSLARAGYVPAPKPLGNILHNTDVAVVVSIDLFTPDPNQPPRPTVSVNGSHIIEMMAINAPGTYQCTTRQQLKGTTPEHFTLHLPMLSAYFYLDQPFPAGQDATVLLLLQRDAGGELVPVDPYLFMIPISPTVAAAKPAADKKPDPLDPLLASLDDPKLRNPIFHLLQSVSDPRVLAFAKTYASDTDNRLRADALMCMAINQDLEAIPLIAAYAADQEKVWLANHGGNSAPDGGLELFKSPKAVPFLNPLLLGEEKAPARIGVPIGDPIDMLRLNAVQALRPIADKSSIPYLFYALHHDDQQNIVSANAFATLKRLSDEKDYPPRSLFTTASPGDTSALDAWWASEKKSWPTTLPAEIP